MDWIHTADAWLLAACMLTGDVFGRLLYAGLVVVLPLLVIVGPLFGVLWLLARVSRNR